MIAETLEERETEFGFTELGFEKRSPKSLDSSVENGVVLVRKGLKQKLLLLLLAIPAIASGTEFKWSCSYFLSAIFLRMVGHIWALMGRAKLGPTGCLQARMGFWAG